VSYAEIGAWIEANQANVHWREDGRCVVTTTVLGDVPLGVEGRTLEEAVRRAMGVG